MLRTALLLHHYSVSNRHAPASAESYGTSCNVTTTPVFKNTFLDAAGSRCLTNGGHSSEAGLTAAAQRWCQTALSLLWGIHIVAALGLGHAALLTAAAHRQLCWITATHRRYQTALSLLWGIHIVAALGRVRALPDWRRLLIGSCAGLQPLIGSTKQR